MYFITLSRSTSVVSFSSVLVVLHDPLLSTSQSLWRPHWPLYIAGDPARPQTIHLLRLPPAAAVPADRLLLRTEARSLPATAVCGCYLC